LSSAGLMCRSTISLYDDDDDDDVRKWVFPWR